MVLEKHVECNILIEGEKVEQVEEFVYLTSLYTNDGKHDRGIERRVNGVLIPTLMYDSESWVRQKKNEGRINAVEMRSLLSMCRVSRKDKCRNIDVKERCARGSTPSNCSRVRVKGHLTDCWPSWRVVRLQSHADSQESKLRRTRTQRNE
ncbi:hypothetical protein EVAR_19172_1 [Eumeta japonica]|uniref:Uncharacterized protein n=1 Tax=Eumeta variegata TaxID=151549 RepID=A0A4C1VMW8_EUMVA|nr:hypothetical protein EVAR_19172_1 [Eumeta japonica]